MRYKKIMIFLWLSMSILISGCQGLKETDQIAYIFDMGLDKAGQDKLKVTFRILSNKDVTSKPGIAAGPAGIFPVIVTSFIAPSIAEAFNLLKTTTSRYPNLTHLKTIVISEELARSGVNDLIASFPRFREYRGTIFLCVCKGRADEFLEKNRPMLEYTPSKWWENFMMTASGANYYPFTKFHNFYQNFKNPGASPYTPYVALNPRTGEDKPTEEKTARDKTNAYLTEAIPRTGNENQAEIAGTTIFSGDKMVGTLDTRQTRMLAILQNKLQLTYFTLNDPFYPAKPLGVALQNGRKPDINVTLQSGRAYFKVKVFLEGVISGIPSKVNYEAPINREMLEAAISSMIKEDLQDFFRHTQELGSDVAGFGYYLRPCFATYQDLQQANLAELYQTADIQVEVQTIIRRTGLMWRSSPAAPTTSVLQKE